jgi:ribosome biogenesis GTPase A
MNKEQVEGQEAAMFEKYLDGIYSRFPIRRLNFFEHNLEVWRQLWRVCEVSDVLLILADIRHPMFHFPPALYNYVVRDLKKPLILVLTKVDLVPTENVVKWTQYFTDSFPGLYICSYTSYELRSSDEEASWSIGTKKKTKRRGKGYTPTGVEEIMAIIRSFGIVKKGRLVPVDYLPPNVQPAVVSLQHTSSVTSSSPTISVNNVGKDAKDAKSPKNSKLEKVEASQNESDEDQDDDDDTTNGEEDDDVMDEAGRQEELKRIEEAMNEDHYQPVRESDHIILGMIGNPNVGKSTFINAMKGRKVCSTSRTPGHTKWKQTIFLNKNIMLVDCPGLVFPAVDMPKQLQILCGIFPIAQVREPFSAIQYMAKFVPIENVYNLHLNDAQDSIKFDPNKGELPWSAWMICEAYAHKRGYHTRRGLDVHRAGLEILFDVIDGRVVLYFLPNQSNINLGAFTDPDGKIVHPLQATESQPTELPSASSNMVSSTSNETNDATSSNEAHSNREGQSKNRIIVVPRPRNASTGENGEEEEDHKNADQEESSDNTSEEGDDAEPKVGNNPFDILR